MPDLDERIAHLIDTKTKPRGSLGVLEVLASQICHVQRTLTPALVKPTIVVFAADHGLAQEPISAYPREVTVQMAMNMVLGGAGINALSRANGIDVLLVDAGVDWPDSRPPEMIDHWMGPGTASSLRGDAMTADEVTRCLAAGADTVEHDVDPACTIIGFGELGIGNTSASSLLVSSLTGLPLEECVGPGTGLMGDALAHKVQVLQHVRDAHPRPNDAYQALQMFGGFEIAQMCGAMLRAHQDSRLLMIDGFVATAAFVVAWSIDPTIKDSAIFCHQSGEPGHARVLAWLGVKPLLNLDMRLGEGTGCAVAYPVIASAVAFVNDMASFDDAGVSTGTPEATP